MFKSRRNHLAMNRLTGLLLIDMMLQKDTLAVGRIALHPRIS
jgi:hypothetical protein